MRKMLWKKDTYFLDDTLIIKIQDTRSRAFVTFKCTLAMLRKMVIDLISPESVTLDIKDNKTQLYVPKFIDFCQNQFMN